MADTCTSCAAVLQPHASFCNRCGAPADREHTLVQERQSRTDRRGGGTQPNYTPHGWLNDDPSHPPRSTAQRPSPPQPVLSADPSLSQPQMRPPQRAEEMRKCPFCAEMIRREAIKCRYCNEIVDSRGRDLYAPPTPYTHNYHLAAPLPPQQWNPGVAALLSFLIPGAGQLYRGNVAGGILWFIAVFIGYVMLILPGFALHIACIYKAAQGDPTRRG